MLKLELPESCKLKRIDLKYTTEQAARIKEYGIDIELYATKTLIDEAMARGFGKTDHYWYLYKQRSDGEVHIWLQNWKRISRRKMRKAALIYKRLKDELFTV